MEDNSLGSLAAPCTNTRILCSIVPSKTEGSRLAADEHETTVTAGRIKNRITKDEISLLAQLLMILEYTESDPLLPTRDVFLYYYDTTRQRQQVASEGGWLLNLHVYCTPGRNLRLINDPTRLGQDATAGRGRTRKMRQGDCLPGDLQVNLRALMSAWLPGGRIR